MMKFVAVYLICVLAVVSAIPNPVPVPVPAPSPTSTSSPIQHSINPCKKCTDQGLFFTGIGCRELCPADTFCFKQCPPLEELESCELCHAFGGDWQLKAGCVESCAGFPCCIQNGVDQC